MSGEQKSVRARYILVAAIIVAIRAGFRNIYVVKGISNQWPTPLIRTRAYEIPGSYYFERNTVQ
jgi:hypothetical protein